MIRSITLIRWMTLGLLIVVAGRHGRAADDDARARSDGDSRYLHRIDMYDLDNRKITAESDRPYSTRNTCGRCHDYNQISHGWHFNSDASARFDAGPASGETEESASPSKVDGRTGEPWLWTDPKTGTSLPLSYRDWPDRYHPRDLGITEFEMTREFGPRIPGGGFAEGPADPESIDPSEIGKEAMDGSNRRFAITGPLEIDCMVCHATSGNYDFELRRGTIRDENFAAAPTAALRLASVQGSAARVKTDVDLSDEKTQSRLPKVVYDQARFDRDGKVFFDLVRAPENNACYQCHSHRTVGSDGVDERWIHDGDVHIESGMQCVDCHRNGIDHHLTRGYPGEVHPAGVPVATLSCRGCHLGTSDPHEEAGLASIFEKPASVVETSPIESRNSRLGSPWPAHHGIPPIHFEVMACTSCHSGPIPESTARGVLTSLSHGLGEKGHRSGREMPWIQAPIYGPAVAHAGHSGARTGNRSASHDTSGDEASATAEQTSGGEASPLTVDEPRPTTTQRMAWASFWAKIDDGQRVVPLHPDRVADLSRRSLRVRKDFVEEILEDELSTSELKQVLGDETDPKDHSMWTEKQIRAVARAEQQKAQSIFDEKISATLKTLQEQSDIEVAAFVAAGKVHVLSEASDEAAAKRESLDDEQAGGDTDEAAPSLAVMNNARLVSMTRRDRTEADAQIGFGAIRWPMSHNVRPAGWSLGSAGCLECHVDDGRIFASTFVATGPTPHAAAAHVTDDDSLQHETEPPANAAGATTGSRDDSPATRSGSLHSADVRRLSMGELRGVDQTQRTRWNGLFGGRAVFKYFTAASMILTVIGLITVAGRGREGGR